MRWLTFIILAIVAVSLQATVAGRIAWLGARPDWVLVLVVFYALHARAKDAMPAGWVAGALADLMTIERFGLLALCYGLTAVLICAVRDWVFTGHPLTQLSVTLVAAVMVQALWLVYRLAVGLPAGPMVVALGSCLYTALWAPPVHWVFLRMPRLLRLRPPRYSYARLPRSRARRV